MAHFNAQQARDAIGRWTRAAGSAARAYAHAGATAAGNFARAQGVMAGKYLGKKAKEQREFMADQADRLPGRIARVASHTVNTYRAELGAAKGQNTFKSFQRSLIQNRQGGKAVRFGKMIGKNAQAEKRAVATRAAYVADIKRAARIGMNTIRAERNEAARRQRMLNDTRSGFNSSNGMRKAGKIYGV